MTQTEELRRDTEDELKAIAPFDAIEWYGECHVVHHTADNPLGGEGWAAYWPDPKEPGTFLSMAVETHAEALTTIRGKKGYADAN